MSDVTGKREKLIAAARRLYHERGIEKTSLADLAEYSGVPLGNVYYYFKTKDALVMAVAAEHVEQIRAFFAKLDALPEPELRLTTLLRRLDEQRVERAEKGCPVGLMCGEANRIGGEVAASARSMLESTHQWLARQFRELGCGAKAARDNANHVLISMQGASLLAQSYQDANVIRAEMGFLRPWLEGVIREARHKVAA
jgi:TetR/AcrR family transcriptional regulator, transcriptional repressor for nem operon